MRRIPKPITAQRIRGPVRQHLALRAASVELSRESNRLGVVWPVDGRGGCSFHVQLDTKGRRGLSEAEATSVVNALIWLCESVDQGGGTLAAFLPTSRPRKNCKGCAEDDPCNRRRICNGKAWGGRRKGNPLDLIMTMLASNRVRFRRGETGDCENGQWGGVDCGDVGDGGGDVFLCRGAFNSQSVLVATIIHECLHLLGADEQAVLRMTHATVPQGFQC